MSEQKRMEHVITYTQISSMQLRDRRNANKYEDVSAYGKQIPPKVLHGQIEFALTDYIVP